MKTPSVVCNFRVCAIISFVYIRLFCAMVDLAKIALVVNLLCSSVILRNNPPPIFNAFACRNSACLGRIFFFKIEEGKGYPSDKLCDFQKRVGDWEIRLKL